MSHDDEGRLTEEISTLHFFASLPRWILRSRTKFSSFLARTFHLASTGSCPDSAVFPIPAPRLGLFGVQGVSKLNAKCWQRLCRQRVLHVIVMALNYLHRGNRPISPALLGRSPTAVHLAIYRRLRTLLTVCDRPDSHLLPPGRSGQEFIARLVELEHFASAHGAFNPDLYGGSHEEGPSPVLKVGKISEEHSFQSNKEFSAVRPYRSLDADRLKLAGDGKWPLADFLDDELWLPFLEPAVLLHHGEPTWDGPDCSREDRAENLKLAKLWDSKGLLALFAAPHSTGLACRVFNAHKSDTVDRQIGDRRWLNGAERHPKGPSAFLPAGPTIASIWCPTTCKLVGSASDRKDFYHQAKVSRARAATNQLAFAFDPEEFRGSAALSALYDDVGQSFDPVHDGDRYGLKPKTVLLPEDISQVYPAFNSLFQGDHLGVEYALSSHCKMLEDAGLLKDDSWVRRHKIFPRGPSWQGVVIDDFFSISREAAASENSQSRSVQELKVAENAYSEHGVFGSDEKTVRGQENFKAIGAEIFSDKKARDAGAITVGAPAAKRIPMACLSLKLAEMPVISRAIAARAAGNWVSIFMYRRSLCCVLAELFSFGSRAADDDSDVLRLPRKVAEELVLASVFGMIAVADISVSYDEEVYATDASLSKGAFTSAQITPDLSETLWLAGDRKGAYTMLDNPARSQLRALGCDVEDAETLADAPSPQKGLDFSFDAVEICGGSGVLSKALAVEGLNVCMPIDISGSKHCDLKDLRLVEWIFHMISTRRFRSVIVEPVCTTFSPAQHPASRSYSEPLGFDRKNPKTYLGNLLAFRCLAILWFAFRHEVIGLLEQPRLSKMAWLSMWQFLLKLGLSEAVTDSCAFGCIHRKPFRFLGCFLPMHEIAAKCPGGHTHVRIEGKYTKASAMYHPGLAKHLASVIARALRSRLDLDEPSCPRFESVVLNDVLAHAPWKVCSVWDWEKPAHINVLESRSLVALQRHLVLKGGDRRFNALLDSRVAKGAHAKGRSSAWSLRPSLMRSCAYIIADNLHPAYGFAPTRLNTADAPTRERPLPVPSGFSILDFLSDHQIASLHASQFSRATAGWIRLFILVGFCLSPGEGCWICNHHLDSSVGPCLALLPGLSQIYSFGLSTCHSLCLGLFAVLLWFCGWYWLPLNRTPNKFWVCQILVIASVQLSPCADAMPLHPVGSGEADRACRRAGNVLQADRVILPQTRLRRDVLLTAFDTWLAENLGTTLAELIGGRTINFEEVAEAVVSYGKDMYQSGKSYGRFSETINALTTRRPALRRNLGAAWDLAFNWLVDEPHEHHAALPVTILLACVSLSLLWGWLREAAVLALTWTAVLRIGEVFAARRSDLVLPQDAAPGVWFALLKVRLPKTRGRAARHQSSRVDPADIVELLTIAFSRLTPDEMLWPWAPATMRRRFAQLQSALGIVRIDGSEIYNLSSLRPGGATYWLQCTEDAEFVRRKGRWISSKVLEIYLQEASVATHTDQLSFETRSRIEELCSQFSRILKRSKFLKENFIPERAWPQLW